MCVFPAFSDSLSPQKLSLEDQRKMAGYWLTMKKLVPSRPHPAAPMKPSTGHTLLGACTGVIRKVRAVVGVCVAGACQKCARECVSKVHTMCVRVVH